MADLSFADHARDAMRDHQIPEVAVYHVVEDAEEIIERDDGRTEYTGAWEGRTFVVIIDDDGRTVVTVWERKWRRPRRR